MADRNEPLLVFAALCIALAIVVAVALLRLSGAQP